MNHPLARSHFRIRAGHKLAFNGVLYKVGGKVGDGAVGVVRCATNPNGTEFAIKFLAPDPKYIAPEAFDDVATRFLSRANAVQG